MSIGSMKEVSLSSSFFFLPFSCRLGLQWVDLKKKESNLDDIQTWEDTAAGRTSLHLSGSRFDQLWNKGSMSYVFLYV